MKKKAIKTLNVGTHIQMTQLRVKKNVTGLISREEDGFVLSFQYYDEEKLDSYDIKKILLSKEDTLDGEDLRNVNDILDYHYLAFNGYGLGGGEVK